MRIFVVLLSILGFIFTGPVTGQNKKSLWTHQYTVPPTFLSNPIASHNAFSDSNLSEKIQRTTARDVLERAGIKFSTGALAIYNPSTSSLIVTNTKEQMELVEAFIETLKLGQQTQTYIQIKDLFFPGKSFEKFLKQLDQHTLAQLPWIELEAKQNPERGFFAGSLPANLIPTVMLQINKDKAIKMNAQPSIMVRPGSPGVVEIHPFRYGVTTHLTHQNTQIILSLHLPPPGENLIRDPNQLNPDIKATIWDGNTAVIKKSMQGGTSLVFVTAELMDPAGQLINPEGGLRGLSGGKR